MTTTTRPVNLTSEADDRIVKVEGTADLPACECGDYHKGDEDHHRATDSCPRTAAREWGGVWLCDVCAELEPVTVTCPNCKTAQNLDLDFSTVTCRVATADGLAADLTGQLYFDDGEVVVWDCPSCGLAQDFTYEEAAR